MYDAAVGRFHTVDPLAELFGFQSPYAYAANNPIFFIDFMGLGPAVGADGLTNEQWLETSRPNRSQRDRDRLTRQNKNQSRNQILDEDRYAKLFDILENGTLYDLEQAGFKGYYYPTFNQDGVINGMDGLVVDGFGTLWSKKESNIFSDVNNTVIYLTSSLTAGYSKAIDFLYKPSISRARGFKKVTGRLTRSMRTANSNYKFLKNITKQGAKRIYGVSVLISIGEFTSNPTLEQATISTLDIIMGAVSIKVPVIGIFYFGAKLFFD